MTPDSIQALITDELIYWWVSPSSRSSWVGTLLDIRALSETTS